MQDPLRVAVLASGSGTNLQSILDACEEDRIDAEVVLVASGDPDARALDRAKRHGARAEFVDPEGRDRRDHEDEIADLVEAEDVELIVLAGYLRILTPEFVERFRWRIINLHPALLPLFGGEGFYGFKVHRAVLDAGARFTGVTTHYVTEEVDAGPIILQAVLPVHPDDTPRSLQRRVLQVEHRILPRTVDLIAQDRVEIVDGNRTRVRSGDDSWAGDQDEVLYSQGY